MGLGGRRDDTRGRVYGLWVGVGYHEIGQIVAGFVVEAGAQVSIGGWLEI